MKLRDHPVFFGVLGVIALGVGVEGGWLSERVATTREARRQLADARREWMGFTTLDPRPTVETTRALERELEGEKGRRERLRAELTAGAKERERWSEETAKAGKAEAYFLIDAFVQRMGREARARGIAIAEGERFGFAEFAHAGPGPDEMAAVLAERAMMEALLQVVFDASPREIFSVRRARRTGTAKEREDSFEMESRRSLRMPGRAETTAFRIGFVGKTATLRAVLNRCAAWEEPWFVRTIEVEEARVSGGRTAERTPVASGLSRFTVTVEWVEISENENAEADT